MRPLVLRRATPLRRRILLALSLLAALPPAAGGQQEPEPLDTFRLRPIVVTATRVPVRREAAPAAVTVITGAELRERGIHDLTDALRSVPGAHVARTGSFGGLTSLFLRGGERDYVKVLVDGVPANEPGGAFDFSTLTADNVDRIEILRGPASVLYGSDAVTGVVQVFTRDGAGRARASASLRAGTYGSLVSDAELAGGGQARAYSIAVSRFGSEGTHPFNSDFRNTVASGRVRIHPDARTDASLSGRFSDSDFHFPTDYKGDLVDRNAVQRAERAMLGLDAGRRLGAGLEARLTLAANRLDLAIDDRPDDDADTLDFYGFRSRSEVARRSADFRLNYRVGEASTVTAGASYERETEDGSSESLSQYGNSTGTFEADRGTRGYYLQALAPLGGRGSVTAGARLDDSRAFGRFGTYRAGVTYQPAQGTRLRAAAGSAFKAPTFFESFSEGYVVGNPALAPERSRGWEVAAERELWGGRGLLAATWFDQDFRDLIQYRGQPFGSTEPNYFNIAAAAARGLELEARLAAGPRIDVAASYTRLDAQVTDAGFQTGRDAEFVAGDRLLRRPERSARLDVAFRPTGRAFLTMSLGYVGERDDLDFAAFPAARVVLAPYTRVDLSAGYRLLRAQRRSLSATLRIENALDQEYEDVRHFPAPGRTILVGVRAALGG